ncbi:MAG: cyclophilin-like fold protein [Thermoplasmatales archaeon]|nr:cyclophilin-like fold protein [Thermoplasmatales archaeon]
MRKIRFIMEGKQITAELIDKNPKTANAVWDALPLQSRINTWDDEIYFGTTVKMGEENAQEKVEIGDVAYWPEGRCICVFFGKTPASTNEKTKAYSPVNVFAKITGNISILKNVVPGSVVRVEKVD